METLPQQCVDGMTCVVGGITTLPVSSLQRAIGHWTDIEKSGSDLH